ncbi:hypothetical protein [Alienimonas chondri]|uniref:Protein kinase domain-containing protein n=1 Tax=Alienimonas chondri TaxID=2681879 RepID=A0ABX1VFK2_9PLAN|nr:hypothetical protein [Alienimonas chondri]NNJ26042.1 hypothetical protein [Alienimonas chondri]
MPAPPTDLAARLAALDPRLSGRAGRYGRAVRRLSAEVPAGELLWLDRLHAAGDLTDHQATAFLEGRDADLRVGPLAITGSLGARTCTASGPTGAAVLKRCGERTDPLDHLCRVVVSHPAIVVPDAVVVQTAGEEQGERIWVRSAPVSGPTLADRIAARGRYDGPEAYTLARRLASGLAAAEAAGLIHGEIHAHNVRLSPGGPVLVDCGLAPLLPPRSGDATRGGWVEAESGPVEFGTEADLRAFAGLMWGVLTGRPPYLFAPRRFGTVHAAAPLLPSITELAPDTPEPLASLIDALLGHRPEAAPISFAEAADRLRPVRPPVSPVRTAGWAIACGALLAGIVGAANGPATPTDAPASTAETIEVDAADPEPPLPTATVEPTPPQIAPAPAVRRVAVPGDGR